MKYEIVCPSCKRRLTLEIKVDSKVKTVKIIGGYEIIKLCHHFFFLACLKRV